MKASLLKRCSRHGPARSRPSPIDRRYKPPGNSPSFPTHRSLVPANFLASAIRTHSPLKTATVIGLSPQEGLGKLLRPKPASGLQLQYSFPGQNQCRTGDALQGNFAANVVDDYLAGIGTLAHNQYPLTLEAILRVAPHCASLLARPVCRSWRGSLGSPARELVLSSAKTQRTL